MDSDIEKQVAEHEEIETTPSPTHTDTTTTVVDDDNNSNDRVMGTYQQLGQFMGTFKEMNILRRFGTLQCQNVLYLQAELAHLEDDLREIRQEDIDSGDDEKQLYPRCWRTLSEELDEGTHSEQYQKVLQIRAKLKEYNDAVLQYKEICKLQTPTKHDLYALRYWLSHEDGGDGFLRGVEGDAYNNEIVPAHDLLTTDDQHRERDLFSAFLADNLMSFVPSSWRWWARPKHMDPEIGGMQYIEDSKLNALAHFIGTFIASMLPAVSIFVLYYVTNQRDRLCIILAFSALFSFSLAIFTKASRVEIFAATAAYASVQVVFIGTNGGVPSPGGVASVSSLLGNS